MNDIIKESLDFLYYLPVNNIDLVYKHESISILDKYIKYLEMRVEANTDERETPNILRKKFTQWIKTN